VWHSAADEDAHQYAGQPCSLYHSAEGHRFDAPFVHGRMLGRGHAQYRQGDRYEGQFENFDRHGEGTCSYGMGGGVYEGQWARDVREGRGRLDARAGEGFLYEGEWLGDRPHGEGVRVGADGSREEGHFGWGALHGVAQRRDALGNMWEGTFVGGQLQGEGTCSVDCAKYKGGFADGAYSGEGQLIEADGAEYTGAWRNGLRHGHGRQHLADGSEYVGEWAAGERHGRGVWRHARRDEVETWRAETPAFSASAIAEYDGEWRHGAMEGEGHLTYLVGSTYEGQLSRGVYHGHGVLRTIDGREVEGTFVDGRATGHATVLLASGELYEGELLEDERHGRGRCVYANGDVYEGEWQHGARHGARGRMVYARSGAYEGGWAADAPEGEGELRMADGRVVVGTWTRGSGHMGGVIVGEASLELPSGGRYTGQLAWLEVDGSGWILVPEGQGCATVEGAEAAAESPEALSPPTFGSSGGSALVGRFEEDACTLPGGAVSYEGTWSRGRPHGEGSATYVDGAVYVGGMAHGLREGTGLMTYPDGREHRGGWQADLPHGIGVAVDADGHVVLEATWDHGALVGACVARYSNGDVYEGACTAAPGTCVREGRGRCVYATGEVYEGMWLDDVPHGDGRMRSRALVPIAAGDVPGYLAAPSSRCLTVPGYLSPPAIEEEPVERPPNGTIKPRVVSAQLSWRGGHVALRLEAAQLAFHNPPKFVSVHEPDLAPPPPPAPIVRPRAVEAEYEGAWVRGVMHGSGTLTLLDSGDKLEAPFDQGLVAGHVKLTTAAGVTLEGRMVGLCLRGRAIVYQPAPAVSESSRAIAATAADAAASAEAAVAAAAATAAAERGRAASGTAERTRIWYEGELEEDVLSSSLRRGGTARLVRRGHGEAQMANGDRYLGAWAEDVPHGQGAYTYELEAQVYEGAWVHGERHGYGELHSTAAADTLDEYKGQWRNDMRCGQGVQRLGASGDVLTGLWVQDALCGHGTLTTGRGDVYEGGFVASLRDGQGRCVYADGSVYEGGWQAGMYEGKGTLVGVGGARCEGSWHRGEMSGAGRRVYGGGAVYEGEFASGLRHGRGTWHDEVSGETYEGEWADDLKEGLGVWTVREGAGPAARYEGTWRQDRLHGPSCRTSAADGTVYEGAFESGRRGGTQPITLLALEALLHKWTALLEAQAAVSGSVLVGGLEPTSSAGLGELVPKFLLSEAQTAEYGYGILSLPSGELYEGFFRDGYPSGAGLWLAPSNEQPAGAASESLCPILSERPRCVLGCFQAGQLSGVGMSLYADGAAHSGGFGAWVPSGHGVRWRADGSVYRGMWAGGAHHGAGELRAPPSAMAAAGAPDKAAAAVVKSKASPVDDEGEDEDEAEAAERAAAVVDAKAAEDPATTELLYRGNWSHGLREGDGRAEYAHGGSYEGQWHAGMPEGRGVLVLPAGPSGWVTSRGGRSLGGRGATYTGSFERGRRCGNGVLRFHESGDSIEGEWSDDGATITDSIFRYATGGEYEGDLDTLLRPHGEGTRTYPDGSSYAGTFARGLRHGQGVGREASGFEYDGSWRADRRHGRGTMRLPDGGVYEGAFAEGVRSGHGLMRYADGSSYEGEWRADVYEGVGTLFHVPDERGTDLYGGHWKAGRMHGHGVFSYADGARYDGQHEQGHRHGYGTLLLRDGTALRGEWSHDELRGQGVITFKDGSTCMLALEAARPRPSAPELCVRAARYLEECAFTFPSGDAYEGEFALLDDLESDAEATPSSSGAAARAKDGDDAADGLPLAPPSLRYVPHGQGTLRTAAGAQIVGVFARGQLEGEGRGAYPDGQKYEGEYRQGLRSGVGTCRYADGSVYKGQWHADGRHGRGLHILPNGDMFSGAFESDAPGSSGTLIYASGGSYDGELRGYRRHGWGVFQETAGYRYEGDWAQDERQGYGREVRENGDIYEGQFARDRRHGRGRLLTVRGEEYDGGWLEGKRDGQGLSIVLPSDEAETQRQRVSASLLVHRQAHFLRLQPASTMGRT
jgi:hypothetical protein